MVMRLECFPLSLEALRRKETVNLILWSRRVCSQWYYSWSIWRTPCLVVFYVGLAMYVATQGRHHLGAIRCLHTPSLLRSNLQPPPRSDG